MPSRNRKPRLWQKIGDDYFFYQPPAEGDADGHWVRLSPTTPPIEPTEPPSDPDDEYLLRVAGQAFRIYTRRGTLKSRPRLWVGAWRRLRLREHGRDARHRHVAAAANCAFDWAGLLTPRLISTEEVGDAKERLSQMVAEGASTPRIIFYTTAQLIYIAVHTAGFLIKKLSPFLGGKTPDA